MAVLGVVRARQPGSGSSHRSSASTATSPCGFRDNGSALQRWPSYRNIGLPIDPSLGALGIARLTGSAVDAWMQKLESPAGPTVRAVSARTVRYVYPILRSALGDAVEQGRLSVNPTDRATAPGPSEARPPEMQPWTTPEFTRFLRWADGDDVADDLPRIGEITPNDMASPRCMRRSPRPAHQGPGVRVDDERLDPTGSAIAL